VLLLTYFTYKDGNHGKSDWRKGLDWMSNGPWMTSLIWCEMDPTALLNVHVYRPPSAALSPLSLTRRPTIVTWSAETSSRPSLYHVRVGVGVALASQNMSTLSPCFWISRLGDASPSSGGADTSQHNYQQHHHYQQQQQQRQQQRYYQPQL